jgi:hypothetical protein
MTEYRLLLQLLALAASCAAIALALLTNRGKP